MIWFGVWLVRGGWNRAARLLLLAQIFGFAFMVAGTHGAFGPQPVPPTTTDFASFYAAGILANAGRPQAAYDAADHRAAESQAVAAGVEEKPFVNPPVFLLVCAPLARLPYLAAFVLFEGATFVTWLALSTRIAGGGAASAMTFAAVPSVWWALGWGQNSFLSASLFATGTLLVDRRPLTAGIAFGALCFKPHLALLVPVALIAGGHWRVIIGATASLCALTASSVICFGLSTWKAFFLVLQARPRFEIGTGLTAHIDPGSAARLLGASSAFSFSVQIVITGLSAISVAWLWWRARPSNTTQTDGQLFANAGLVAGTLAAAPFLLFYDLVIASLAAVWLIRGVRSGGRHAWGREQAIMLAALFVLDLVAFPSAALLHVAAGTPVCMALLWLSLRHASPSPCPPAIALKLHLQHR